MEYFSVPSIHHYLIVNPAKKVVMRYEVRPDGSLAAGRVFYDMTGAPGEDAIDGIKVDQQGNLWLPAEAGTVVAIAKAELEADGDVEAGATVLTSDAFGSVIDLAFNPPPDWSPIHGPE